MLSIRRNTPSSVVLVGALLLIACGGSRSSADSAADQTPPGQRPEAAAPRVLTPVDAPPGVVARMRVRNMGALLDGAMDAASVPLNWRQLLEQYSAAASYLPVIDWEGSIEGVAAMNVREPVRPHGALSIGVTGIEPVLRVLEDKGLSAIEGPGEVFYFENNSDACAVGPAISGSVARIVCSERRASLDVLLPYALRGLPRETLSPADIFVEFDMEPLRATYGKELKTYLRWAPAAARTQHVGNPTFDRALSDGATELSREAAALIDELRRVTMQVSQESGTFHATLNVELLGRESDTVKVLRNFAARQDGVPQMFDELPSTASAAGFSREISAELATKWMSILADLAHGSVELEGANGVFSKRLGALIRKIGPHGKTSVFARGPLISTLASGQKRVRPAWVLSGTTRSKAEVEGIFDDIVFILSSPELKKLSKTMTDWPKVTRKQMAIAGAPRASVYEWKLPQEMLSAARVLGAPLASEKAGDDLADAFKGWESGLIAVHEYGGNTWISWGSSKDELAESFQALSNPDTQKLASLGDWGGVRGDPAVSAGFSKLDGLVGMASFLFPAGLIDDWESMKRAMPGQGQAPVIYSFSVDSQGEKARATWKLVVPAEFTQDLAALALLMAQREGK
jgi:hypothetical protein